MSDSDPQQQHCLDGALLCPEMSGVKQKKTKPVVHLSLGKAVTCEVLTYPQASFGFLKGTN